jgi:hypothetical protein
MRRFTLLAYGACLVITGTFSADADVFLKQKHHADAYTIMNQQVPASDRVATIWLGKDKARIDQTADTTIIFKLDKKSMIMVYHKSKTYAEMPVQDVSAMMSDAIGGNDEMDEESKAQAQAMMQQMAAAMKPTFSVKATTETKKIKTWNAHKYIMTTTIAGVAVNAEIWACPDIKVDYAFYNKLMNVYLAKMPGMEDIMKEVEKIKGFMVLMTSSSRVMGASVTTSEELLEINEKAAPPAGGYEVPAGYTKVGK